MNRHALAAILGAAALGIPASASACAACACGDPTLFAVGTEKPYAGRLRLSLDARYRSDSVGVTGVDKLTLHESRADVQAAWSPSARWTLLLTLPAGYRLVSYANSSSQNTFFAGDPELRAKAFFWQNRAFDPQHLLSILAGLTLPVGGALSESIGRVPLELGVSLGVPTVAAGVAYAGFSRPWSLYTSAVFSAPLGSAKDGDRPAQSLRGTVALQHQTFPTIALRASVHIRVDGIARDQGSDDPNSGGRILFAGPEALWSPGGDLTFFGYARIPASQALRGAHDEGAILGAGVAWDP